MGCARGLLVRVARVLHVWPLPTTWTHVARGACCLDAPHTPEVAAPSCWAQAGVLDVMKEWDADGNRQLTKKEFHKVVMFMGRGEIKKEESGDMFKMFDEDGAGTI